MLINVPSADGLNEIALRLHFDGWKRCLSLLSDFLEVYEIQGIPSEKDPFFLTEWEEYIDAAQSELAAICMTIQQSAELRLKSILCDVSPFLLLLNGSMKFGKDDIDFTQLRTLDAVDLPGAVRSLTKFHVPPSYLEEYGRMRSLRNQVVHLGAHPSKMTPTDIAKVLCKQYTALWPDGRWLHRRVKFDGNSARNFFHDNRYSSSESDVMAELPLTIDLMDGATFKRSFGVSKNKLTGFCPRCMAARASKWDAEGHATAYRTGKAAAFCAMCEQNLVLSVEVDTDQHCCEGALASIPDGEGPICFHCG